MKQHKEYRLYFTYNETSSGGDALEEGRYASRSDQEINIKFLNIYKSQPKDRFFCDSIELSEKEYDLLSKKDFLYLAVIRYSTGDTFGRTNGAWSVVGVSATRIAAEKLCKKALEGIGYKPWEGYFERYSHFETHLLKVEDE